MTLRQKKTNENIWNKTYLSRVILTLPVIISIKETLYVSIGVHSGNWSVYWICNAGGTALSTL